MHLQVAPSLLALFDFDEFLLYFEFWFLSCVGSWKIINLINYLNFHSYFAIVQYEFKMESFGKGKYGCIKMKDLKKKSLHSSITIFIGSNENWHE